MSNYDMSMSKGRPLTPLAHGIDMGHVYFDYVVEMASRHVI